MGKGSPNSCELLSLLSQPHGTTKTRCCDVCQRYLFSAHLSIYLYAFRAYFQHLFFPPLFSIQRDKTKTAKKPEVLRLMDIHKRQKKGMQNPLLD